MKFIANLLIVLSLIFAIVCLSAVCFMNMDLGPMPPIFMENYTFFLLFALILIILYLLIKLSKANLWVLTVLIVGAVLFSLHAYNDATRKNEKQILTNIINNKELDQKILIYKFCKLYYSLEKWRTTFLGIESLQYPTDNWVMQDIIFETKPDFIIETGTWKGGSTLFYAMLLEQINEKGKVITLDIEDCVEQSTKQKPLWKNKVEFIVSSSVDENIVHKIAEEVKGKKVLVTLDSDHSMPYVLKELKLYAPLVSLDSYIVVSDTSLGGHPNMHPSCPDEGPWGAVHEFLKTNNDFKIDYSREKYILTQNPSGNLKRIK